MVNHIIYAVRQAGEMDCPICKNHFVWRYCVGLENDPETGTPGALATIEQLPKDIRAIASADGAARFQMSCPKCATILETEPMNPCDSGNYNQYR